jgi:neutral ceramidase
LSDLRSGKPLERTYPYPLQVWQLGGRQLLITLGGEPVVDYALKFKREFGQGIWVAGYANDVMCYIPSLRVLNEDKPPLRSPLWGYEGSQAMKVLGLPALRWADDVEDLVSASARRLVNETKGGSF